MGKVVKFNWTENRKTFLWPDHPLVIAGDKFLEIVIDGIQHSRDKGLIVDNLLDKSDYSVKEVERYVDSIIAAIDSLDSDTFINTALPDSSSLSMATINLTKNCNLRCNHCYAGTELSTIPVEMTIEDITRIIYELSHLIIREPKLLIISGGEPLLEKEKLVAAIAVGQECGFNLRLNTNGLLITDDIAQELAAKDVLVQVSIDGADAETNAILRGSTKVFGDAIQAVKLLVKNGCRTRISSTIHSENFMQIPQLINLSIDLGVEQFVTSSLVEIGNAKIKNIKSVEFADEFEILHGAVKESEAKQKMTCSTLLCETITAIRAGIRFVYCGTGCSTLCINSDGSLYPCINMVRDGFQIGSALDHSLSTLWKESAILNKLRQLNVSSMNTICRDCIFRHFCGGYCRGETLSAGKKLYSPYSKCAAWKRGLLKILDIISETPQIYDFKIDPLVAMKHRE